MPAIPAFCLSCGRVFASQMFGFGPGAHVRIFSEGNMESCPYCGGMAQTADGVFQVTDDVLKVVSAPQITRDMLAALQVIIRNAFTEKKPVEEVAQEVEKIDASLGPLIRSSATRGNYLIALLLILYTIQRILSVSLDMKLDVNQLLDQILNGPSPVIMTPAPPARPVEQPAPLPTPETKPENPRTI